MSCGSMMIHVVRSTKLCLPVVDDDGGRRFEQNTRTIVDLLLESGVDHKERHHQVGLYIPGEG